MAIKRKKISVKIALIIGSVEVIAMTVLFFIINYNLTNILGNKAINDMNVIASDRANLIEVYINGCCNFIDGYSKTPTVQEAFLNRNNPVVKKHIHDLTQKYASSHADIEGLYIADWDTFVIEHTNPESVGIPFRSEIRAKVLEHTIKKEGKAFCAGIALAPLTKKMVIPVYAPVYDENNNAIGFAGAGFFTEGLEKELSRFSETSIDYSLINIKTGEYIFTDNVNLVGKKCTDVNLLNVLQTAKDNNLKNNTISYKDGESVVSCLFMQNRDWIFTVKDSNENAFKLIQTARKILLTICLTIAIGMVLVCVFSVEYQMLPIREINSEIIKLQSSNYTHDEKIKAYCSRQDEFGMIAKAVEELHLSMESQNQFFLEILEAQAVGTLITDADDKKIILINKVAMQFYGVDFDKKDELTIADIRSHFDEAELKKINEARQIAKLSKDEITFETFVTHADGKKIYLLSHTKCLHLSNGETVLIFSTIDISARKKLEQNLLVLSDTDSLTSICNRRSGEYKVKRTLIDGKFGMFCLFDANKFKFVNDTFGHAAGDKVLIEIAKCMKKNFRDSDILIRLGGDEFVIFATGIETRETGELVLNRFMKNIEAISIPELGDHKITISLGAVLISENEDFAQMYTKADSLMYDCKKQGGNAYKFYNM